jgi:hypothetical protein
MATAQIINHYSRLSSWFLQKFLGDPFFRAFIKTIPSTFRGFSSIRESWQNGSTNVKFPREPGDVNIVNPLETYFHSHKTGRGVWKWLHYFDIYHRHLNKFVGSKVHIVEVGIYSGGSLEMWREYFGEDCYIYGIDIEHACKTYENSFTKVFIGDQVNRNFWREFKGEVPTVSILIDDGGHHAEQQIVTLEEMFPHLIPGGIYICEDVHGEFNRFASYVQGMSHNLNAFSRVEKFDGVEGSSVHCKPTSLQAWIRGIHFYPYIIVIEKTEAPVQGFSAPKHGTEWQSFH